MQTLKDSVPEVKQATDKESRNAEGGFRGAGRGRGRGSFAARGFAAAGLTGRRPNGENGGPGAGEGAKSVGGEN